MIGKKKINEIRHLSVMGPILDRLTDHEIDGKHWMETPPEMWLSSERQIFDIANEVEMELKSKIIEIINRKKS